MEGQAWNVEGHEWTTDSARLGGFDGGFKVQPDEERETAFGRDSALCDSAIWFRIGPAKKDTIQSQEVI